MKNPKFYVKQSVKHGQGIFALHHLFPGRIIGTLEGDLHSLRTLNKKIESGECVYSWEFEKGRKFLNLKGDLGTYLNHACSPNCYVKETKDFKLKLYPYNEIIPGEELTINYGNDGWEFPCDCGQCFTKK